ncbi:hypothetical protein ACM55G_14755 [Flavobacterium sp. LB3P122]|uniref:hypothetical protein n=1 Tax=Flavobacterium algoriphilum TaxID=3398738 RepID=UPI003A84E82D
MKKYLVLLLISTFAFGQVNTTTTTAGKYKMNIPALGTKNDSLVIWNGTDKFLKILPVSQIKGTTNLDYIATPSGGTVFSSTGNDAVLPLVTGANAGLQSPGNKTKLDGIEAGAQVNVPTNLEGTTSPDGGVIFSSTGTPAFIPLVSTSVSGLLAPADKSKLNSIAPSATANQADSYLLSRTNHTDFQAIATVTGLQTALDAKVDKVTGKSLLSDTEISRLATLANYTHPTNHPPSIITQDVSNRFVTDAEKSAWNAKQSALGYTAENVANKNVASGYAGLGSNGKLISSQLPDITISDTFITASQASMLAVIAETGDVAVRTDLNKTFILKGTNPAVLSDWQELLTPTSAVTTVFGRNGAVTAQTGDYNADQITETTTRKFQTANQKTFNDATSSIQTQLNAKQVSGSYETAFAKNTAFNKNFGTIAGTIAEGNDSRILNGQTAFGWGNHSGLYSPFSGSVNYIQNQNATAQTANLWVTGNGTFNGNFSSGGATPNTNPLYVKTGVNANFRMIDAAGVPQMSVVNDAISAHMPFQLGNNWLGFSNTGTAAFTSIVTAPTFIGALSGNAASATNLSNQWLNDGTTFLASYGLTAINTTSSKFIYNTIDAPLGASGLYSTILSKRDGAYGSMLAMNIEPGTSGLYTKTLYNGTWSSWKTIVDSGNIGSQSVNYANSAGSASNSTLWNGGAYYGSALTPSSNITYGMVYDNANNRFGIASSEGYKSWLGLGSNAYNSTAYLPLTGGNVTGALSGTYATFSSSVTATAHVTTGGTATQLVKGDGSLTVGYKVYTALLTQSGTTAPVATVLDNTLGPISFGYSSAGSYTINLSGGVFFTDNKTVVFCTKDTLSPTGTGGVMIRGNRSSNSTVNITTVTSAGGIDGQIVNSSIEIRVYN